MGQKKRIDLVKEIKFSAAVLSMLKCKNLSRLISLLESSDRDFSTVSSVNIEYCIESLRRICPVS